MIVADNELPHDLQTNLCGDFSVVGGHLRTLIDGCWGNLDPVWRTCCVNMTRASTRVAKRIGFYTIFLVHGRFFREPSGAGERLGRLCFI